MSNEIAQAVWNYEGNDLNGVQTSILSRMAWYAAWDGTKIYPSISTLSQQTKFSITTIKENLKYLRDQKFIIVDKESNKANHLSTEYRINFERIGMPIPIDMQRKNLSTQPVDKYGKTTPPRAPNDIGARAPNDLGARAPRAPQRSLTNIINKDHMIEGQQDDLKNDLGSKELVRQLLKAGINQKSIVAWIAKFGAERVNSLWRELIHPKHDKVATIQNLGAYFRKVMDSVDAYQPIY